MRRITFGKYPEIGLSEARERGDTIRVAVRQGADPAHETTQKIAATRDDEARQSLTFSEIADLYIERYAKRQKASWKNDEGYLSRDARPAWGKRPAHSISKQDVAKLLSDIKERAPTSANRTRSVLARLFSWAVDEGLLDASPLLGVKKPHKEGRGKDRVLTDDEIRVLWQAIEASEIYTGTKSALQVLALLGQRPAEVAGMARSELVVSMTQSTPVGKYRRSA